MSHKNFVSAKIFKKDNTNNISNSNVQYIQSFT
jgi:hypothetical protein